MTVPEQELKFAYWRAGANWMLWSADFEFDGAPEDLPVLAHKDRFVLFTVEYAVLRYKHLDLREAVRSRLRGSDDFRSAIDAPDGSGVDRLAQLLKAEYQAENPRFGVERSFVSKLAAFARPEVFVAWDQFARRGLAKLIKGRYRSYADYLGALNSVLEGPVGVAIRDYLSHHEAPTPKRDAFARRVLDVYLMAKGGRWLDHSATLAAELAAEAVPWGDKPLSAHALRFLAPDALGD